MSRQEAENIKASIIPDNINIEPMKIKTQVTSHGLEIDILDCPRIETFLATVGDLFQSLEVGREVLRKVISKEK